MVVNFIFPIFVLMKNDKVMELYKKMVDAYADYTNCFSSNRKAPMAKTMTKYINHIFGRFGYEATSEPDITSGYWLYSTYTGTKVIVKFKNETVFEFSNVFGESNVVIVKFILELHKEYLPGFERNMKIDSIIED